MPAELFTDMLPAGRPYLFTDSPTSRVVPSRTINIISSDNGVGLSVDMDLLQQVFEEAGYDVARVNWRAHTMRECGTAFFLELLNPRLLRFATRNVGVFNMEWFLTEWRRYMPLMSQIWAKSIETQQVFAKWGIQADYTGFISRDMLDESVKRTTTCLHLRGKSNLKNTEAVLEAWRRNPDLPHLTIISSERLNAPGNVTVLPRIPYEQLVQQVNTHRIHLCPSRTEGWGHYITEGLSAKAVIVTTNASPMNEHVSPEWGELITPTAAHARGPVVEYDVSPNDIAAAIRRLAALSEAQLDNMGNKAREHFLTRNEAFKNCALERMEMSL